ncbi:phycobilisome rod-core linker polypeptide [Chroococcidiopsis sp. CCMEE 29]|uniref:phycobilisome rod-core linker polypeptide n=1 Tax=Chroococcidiopsis sp. CCMEE 29 TaxID=155894 RepID=UPI002020C1F2|nr:phycobilisome rod-core linker polypeptide [Chroococcidiopsis sp. CCMEE 29]
MSIPLLEITLKTQNQRVEGYEVPDEDNQPIYRLTDVSSNSAVDEIIWAAYRQIFSEHLILESYRQLALESQLRNRSISVREFVQGLGKSDVYRELVADTNSNYRLVDITFKRFLGRATYGKDEQIAWSIVIATRGLHGFIDAVVDSDEYRQNFGDYIVPYQRRRMEGRPFNLVNPRYTDYWRNRLIEREGRSYYQAQRYGTGNINKQPIRQAIPSNFLSMAGEMLLPETNYQRTMAQTSARVKSLELPDTARGGTTPPSTVKRTSVTLPYRYIPATPKV